MSRGTTAGGSAPYKPSLGRRYLVAVKELTHGRTTVSFTEVCLILRLRYIDFSLECHLFRVAWLSLFVLFSCFLITALKLWAEKVYWY